MSLINDTPGVPLLVCNFCGSQQTTGGGCSKCGASSAKFDDQLIIHSTSEQSLSESVMGLSKSVKFYSVAIMCCLIFSTYIMYSRAVEKPVKKHTPIAQTVPAPLRRLTPEKKEVINPIVGLSIGPMDPSTKKIKKVDVEPTQYPKAKKTWGDKFNPYNTIPTKGFNAYYFDTIDPDKWIHNEYVDKIAVRYSWNEFHGIPSQRFGAYWVGTINVDKTEFVEFSVKDGWSSARVIVNDNVIYQKGKKPPGPDGIRGTTVLHGQTTAVPGFKSASGNPVVRLSKGEHVVEVEYLNHWHTTDFNMGIGEVVTRYPYRDIARMLPSVIEKDFEILYASVYESNSNSGEIIVDVDKRSKPVVLILDSYDSVNWQVTSQSGANILAVIASSYKTGTSVELDSNSDAITLYGKGKISSLYSKKTCHCTRGNLHCNGKETYSELAVADRYLSKKISGFTREYSASYMRIPVFEATPRYRQQLLKEKETLKEKQRQCRDAQYTDINDLLG